MARLIQFLWVLVILMILSGCNLQNRTPETHIEKATSTPVTSIGPDQETTVVIPIDQENATVTVNTSESIPPDPNPPLALAFIENQTVHFECIDHKTCIPDMNLEGHIHFDPYNLSRVYYWNQESAYITLFSTSEVSEKMTIIHSNPQTGDIKSIESPGEIGYTLMNIAAGRLILARYQGQSLHIVENDLSVTEVDVGVDIYRIIVAGDRIIALNQVPLEKNGQTYVDVSVIDVVSRRAKPERLNLLGLEILDSRQMPQPSNKYLSHIQGVSGDLKNLYCTFISGNEPRIVKLGTFSVESPGVIASTLEPVAPFGYGQYRWMLFRSYLGESESGISSGSLYDMLTGRSLIDYDQNPEWRRKKLWIVPFGDYFLLGRSDEIILLSLTGTILERYALPDRWIDQDYNIVRFEN